MKYHGHDLQSAVDHVGDLCAKTIDTFSANKEQIPSWDPEIDDMVARYVKGLQDWIVGYVHSPLYLHYRFLTFLIDRFTGASELTDISVPRVWR
jgi:alpha-muurolene/germacrene-A/gamma-muurolene synthase